MITATELLQPIAPDKPCGEDISDDPLYLELETMVRGKEETQFSPAEPPNWKKIRERCLELWKRSKHLRVAATLTVAELEMEGLNGFREGLALMNGMIQTYWGPLYPSLSEAEGNDPTERVNIVASLSAPLGTYMDPLRVLERLRNCPLANSPRLGRFSAADIHGSKAGKTGPDGKPPPTEAQLAAAFADTKPEELAQTLKQLEGMEALVGEIENGLTSAVGVNQAVSLEVLKKELKALSGLLPNSAPSQGADGAEQALVPGASGAAVPIKGEIQSRQDVLTMLDKICVYYRRHEPSSPVPFLLTRAKRLAEKDFMAIINDLSPEALDSIQKITGEKPKPEEPAAE